MFPFLCCDSVPLVLVLAHNFFYNHPHTAQVLAESNKRIDATVGAAKKAAESQVETFDVAKALVNISQVAAVQQNVLASQVGQLAAQVAGNPNIEDAAIKQEIKTFTAVGCKHCQVETPLRAQHVHTLLEAQGGQGCSTGCRPSGTWRSLACCVLTSDTQTHTERTHTHVQHTHTPPRPQHHHTGTHTHTPQHSTDTTHARGTRNTSSEPCVLKLTHLCRFCA